MKGGHPLHIQERLKNRPDTPPESAPEEARNPADRPALAAQDAQDAREGLQPQGETALAEPDAQDGPAATLTHLRGVTVGGRDRRVTYAPHLVLSDAKFDGRTSLARIEKQRRDQIARDRGYDGFADAPAVLREEISGYVRLSIICDLLWAGFLSGGRLMLDAFRDFEQVKVRKAVHLGLERRLRDAKAVHYRTYASQKYGARNGTSEHR